MNYSDNESSICSTASGMTVSCFGEDDVPLEEAIDGIFKQIQDHINQMHCEIRNLVQSDDRGEDYDECYAYWAAIKEHVDEGCKVFKELTKVARQILPPKPKGWIEPSKRNLPSIPE